MAEDMNGPLGMIPDLGSPSWTTEELEWELESQPKPRKPTPPLRAACLAILAAALCGIVWINRVQIRDYYFPPPVVVTTNDLSVEDVNNEEQIIAELEAKYEWLWIMEVHRMSDGTVSVLSGIYPDSQQYVGGVPTDEWQAITRQATVDIIIAFAPAARNGVVYLRYARVSSFTLVGVLLCDTMGTKDVSLWRCQGANVEPPVVIQPDWIEYPDRLDGG